MLISGYIIGSPTRDRAQCWGSLPSASRSGFTPGTPVGRGGREGREGERERGGESGLILLLVMKGRSNSCKHCRFRPEL